MIRHGGQRAALATLVALIFGAGAVLADGGGDGARPPERVAFDSDRDGNLEIYTMLPDGTGVTRVTTHPGQDVDPSWSPPRSDGAQRIAFASNRDGDFDLYSIEADGEDVRRLTQNDISDTGPAWSPDGRLITFASRRDDNTDIYVMRADGRDEQRLTDSPAVDHAPAWSPDGSEIAFESTRDGRSHIWTMSSDGGDPRQVTRGASDDAHPTWFQFGVTADPSTPWDDLIAFDRLSEDGNYEVQSVAVTGETTVNLSASIGEDVTPAWSSGGRRIAFASTRDGHGDIYVMDGAGNEQTRLTREPSNEGNPDWSGEIVDDRMVAPPARAAAGGGGCREPFGTNAAEKLIGDFRDNVLCGYDGNDKLYGRGGDDKLLGMDGRDLFVGGPGDDNFWAKDGVREILRGGPGRDVAVSYDHVDRLHSVRRYP